MEHSHAERKKDLLITFKNTWMVSGQPERGRTRNIMPAYFVCIREFQVGGSSNKATSFYFYFFRLLCMRNVNDDVISVWGKKCFGWNVALGRRLEVQVEGGLKIWRLRKTAQEGRWRKLQL
uniref:Uncharacterized protein n=1 Tax=Pavo cristatus TaxID=9049 RepID=A0A8C9FED3_PAVCR